MPRRLFVLLVPLALLAGACSKDDKKEADVTTTTTSTTIDEGSSTTNPPPDGSSTTQTAPTSTTTPAGDGIPLRASRGTGSGSFAFTLVSERSEVCYRLTTKAAGEHAAAWIQRDADSVHVVDLNAPEGDGTVNTCAASDALLLEEMRADPTRFSVHVVGAASTLSARLK